MKGQCLFLLCLSVLTITVSSAPTEEPTDKPCIPHGEECDPEVTHFRFGEVTCCQSYDGCVRQYDPTKEVTLYRCSPIFIGK